MVGVPFGIPFAYMLIRILFFVSVKLRDGSTMRPETERSKSITTELIHNFHKGYLCAANRDCVRVGALVKRVLYYEGKCQHTGSFR